LERSLGALARKVAARIATRPADSGPPDKTVIDRDQVDDYLGAPRFKKEMAFRTSRPGVATGVAWTETGGDVLYIEATLLPGGNQNIILTGQLGNVMQESARAALSHIGRVLRSSASRAISWRSTISTFTFRPARSRRTDLPRASRWRRRFCRPRGISRCGRTWR
jgi:ATP-dependent Lon protease